MKHYDEGIPTTLTPYPQRTLLYYISEAAQKDPLRTSLLFNDMKITWSELESLSDTFAAILNGLGVKQGDRLIIILPNCLQFIIAELGTWKMGAIVVTINPYQISAEWTHLLENINSEICIVLSSSYANLKSVQPLTGIKKIIVTDVDIDLSTFAKGLRRLKPSDHHVKIHQNDSSFSDLMSTNQNELLHRVTVESSDPAVVLMSSGTTGKPKSILGLHKDLVITGLQLRAWLKSVINDKEDTIILPIPLFHAYGNVGVQSLAFIGRNALSLISVPTDIRNLIDTITRVKPAFLPATPQLLKAIIDHPRVKTRKVDLTTIKLCFSGGSPLSAEYKKQFEKLTGGRVIEGYSLTEAMMACVIEPVQGLRKIGSVGLALPDVEVAIVDAHSGNRPLKLGEVGEILLRGPQIPSKYGNNPLGTTKDFQYKNKKKTWLRTGDLGHLDEDGYLFIIDRKKELIKVGSYYISPREIEEVISSHNAVDDVGVAEILDSNRTKHIQALIVLKKGISVTSEDIQKYCRGKLESYKVPSCIEFRDVLPRSYMGKVIRRLFDAE